MFLNFIYWAIYTRGLIGFCPLLGILVHKIAHNILIREKGKKIILVFSSLMLNEMLLNRG